MLELPTSLNQWLKTRLALPLLVLNGWVLLQLFQFFEPLVTVFLLAAVFAFVLNYPVRFLERRNLDRSYAILMVLLVSLVVLIALGVTLIPLLIGQLTEIANLLPEWIASTSQKLQSLQSWARVHRLPINLSRVIAQLSDRLPAQLEPIADQSVNLTLGAVGSLSEVLLVLVLTLYLLLDGKRVWDSLFQWLPPSYLKHRQSLEDNFHNYFIGQATLGLVMGSALSVAFFALNVPYSLLLGLLVGVMTLIPFGDILSYGLISLLLLSQDVRLGVTALAVALVIDQLVDQAVAPRVLGGFTGLKPIWVILSIVLGAKVAGLSGLLIAVPIAGFIKSVLDDMPSGLERATDAVVVNLSTNGQEPLETTK